MVVNWIGRGVNRIGLGVNRIGRGGGGIACAGVAECSACAARPGGWRAAFESRRAGRAR